MGTPWWQLAWVWTATGWTLAAVGLLILVMALFRDRARGRRRCPGCWYDMAGAKAVGGGSGGGDGKKAEEHGRDAHATEGRHAGDQRGTQEGHAGDQRATQARDERATEEWVCPECGRRIRGVRALMRTRRRWWRAAGAVVVMLLGYGALVFVAVRDGGWTRAVPMTVLAALAPTEKPDRNVYPGLTARAGPNGTIVYSASRFAAASALPALPWREQLAEEAWRRVGVGAAWRWQSQWYVSRALKDKSLRLDGLLIVPGRWPAGEPIPALVAEPAQQIVGRLGFAYQWGRSVAPDDSYKNRGLAAAGAAGEQREIDVELRLVSGPVIAFAETVRRSVRIVENSEALFHCDASAETSERVRNAMDVRLWLPPRGGASIVMDDRSESRRWNELRMGLGCQVTVRLGDEVAGRGTHWPEWSRAVFKDWDEVVAWEPGMAERVRAEPERVRVEVRGVARESLRVYMAWPFTDTDPACWTGSFEVTPRVVERPERVRDLSE